MIEAQMVAPRRPCVVVHGWLTSAAAAAFEAEAGRRRTHPDRLVAQVLDLVARDDLFRALLDL